MDTDDSTYERIFGVVCRIPTGCVATYGQVAALAEASGPRQVGYALHSLSPGDEVPWHRVINAQGRVSPRSQSGDDNGQRMLLEAEGVAFDSRGKISLERFGWDE